MALSISGFNPSAYRSESYLPNYNLDLIGKVIQHKQNLYDQNFAKLQSQKSTALNIQFLNKDRQNEVNQLNDELQKKFDDVNGDMGDLSSSESLSKYMSWFDGFKKNTDLIRAYGEDKKWQSELSKVQSLKQSKDPIKAGYSQVNEAVFNHKLETYANSKKGEQVGFQGYTPYTDIVGETTRIYKNLPKKKTVNMIPDPKNPGYMIEETVEGHTYDDLVNVMGAMDGNLKEQFRIEAEYNQIVGMKTNPSAYRDNLFKSYTSLLDSEKAITTTKLNEARQKAAIASTEEERQQYFGIQSQLENRLIDLTQNLKTKEWFNTASEDTLLGLSTQIHERNKISGVANGLKATVSRKYTVDQTYLTKLRIGQQAEQFNKTLEYRASQDAIKNRLDVEDLKIKQGEFGLKQQKLGLDQQELELKAQVEARKAGLIGANGTTGTPLFDASQNANQQFNSLQETASREDYAKVEKTVQTRSFNIADGIDYQIPINKIGQSNDQILEKLVSLYDEKAPGRSVEKMRQMLNENNLAENISLNTMLQMMPQLMEDTRELDIKNKVGAIKTKLTEGFEGKLNNDPKYGTFSNSFTAFKQQQQYHNAFMSTQREAWNESRKKLGITKPWEQLSNTDKNTLVTEMANWTTKNDKLPLYGIRNSSYQGIGDKLTDDNAALWNEQKEAAAALRNITGVPFDIPQQLISGVSKHDDGTTTYMFKGEEEFKKHLGDDYVNIIKNSSYGIDNGRFKNVEKGQFAPTSMMVIKTNPIGQVNNVDKIIANGISYFEVIPKGNINHQLELYKSMDMYHAKIDGKLIPLQNTKGATPSAVLQYAKNLIQSQL